MTESLADYLQELNVTHDGVEQGARCYVAEISNDLSFEQMRQVMIEAAGDANEVDKLVETLAQSPTLRTEASLVVLSGDWGDDDKRDNVIGALEGAQEKLPAIEIGMLAIVAMYGMYLLATGGVAEEESTVELDENGKFQLTTKKTYREPTGPLSAIVKLFGGK